MIKPAVFPKFAENAMPCETASIEMSGMQKHQQTIATRPVWVFAQMHFATQLAAKGKGATSTRQPASA